MNVTQKKATFSTDKFGVVTLSYDIADVDGCVSRATRVFRCPVDGGYVSEYRRGGWMAVCDGLIHIGDTLVCRSREELPTIIRREYRRMRRGHE